MTGSASMPKTIKTIPGTRIMCPENCRYRNKLAPFCGYCMMEMLKRKKEPEEQDGNSEKEIARETRKERL